MVGLNGRSSGLAGFMRCSMSMLTPRLCTAVVVGCSTTFARTTDRYLEREKVCVKGQRSVLQALHDEVQTQTNNGKQPARGAVPHPKRQRATVALLLHVQL